LLGFLNFEWEEIEMTYTITEPCIDTKDTACVDVCPVDCIHPTKTDEDFEKETMLYVDPEECIDCGACEPVCPVEAIFEEAAVPDKWKHYNKINADWYLNKKA
jgi:NAD-dependent dihydropyrimidine dehydrogenase PreA subunit